MLRNKKSSRVGIFVILAVLAAFALTWAAEGKTKITYLGRGDSFEKEVYDQLLSEFMAQNPDIEVEMEWVVGNAPEIYQRLLVTTAAGTPPDAYWVHSWSMGDLLKQNMLYPLNNFVAKEPGLIERYYRASMDEFSRNGQVLGLPRESSTLVLIYNVDSFDQAGVAYPTESWTWDTLLEAARKLTFPSETNPKYGLEAPIVHDRNISFIWQNGGRFLNEERTESMLSRPESVGAIRWVWQLMYEHKVSAPPTGPQPSFVAGTAAMMYQIRGIVRSLIDANVNWGAVIVPSGRYRYNRIASAGHGVHAFTKHPEAAYRLVKFLSGPVAIKALAARGLTVPPLREVAREVFTEPRDQVFYQAMEYARAEPVTPGYFDILAVKNQAFDLIWRNEAAIEPTLQELDRKITQMLSEFWEK